tara:strand:- start:2158 stop:2466 length:309 start_codon:yes stop_codon:yes gene_type:complete
MKYAFAGLVAFLVCASCATPWIPMEAANAADAALQQLRDAGEISNEVYQHVAKALMATAGGGYDWPSLFDDGIQLVVTLIAGYFGIRQWRGTPTARKGSLPK